MKRILSSILLISILTLVAGCSNEKANSIALEEKEEQAKKEKLEQERLEKLQVKWDKEAEEKALEEESTDLIHYRVGRYSEDGKFVNSGKYTLNALPTKSIEVHNLRNRGVIPELDRQTLVVDSAFLGGEPSSKFNIYYVLWNKGERENPIRVSVAYRSSSKGW